MDIEAGQATLNVVCQQCSTVNHVGREGLADALGAAPFERHVAGSTRRSSCSPR